jgi:hypothetical protein
VPWLTQAAGALIKSRSDGQVVDVELAGLSAATRHTQKPPASIVWGDGCAPQPAVIAGSDPSGSGRDAKAATLFTVTGSHAYAPGKTYTGTVSFTDGKKTWPATFEVVPPWRLDGFYRPVNMGTNVVNPVRAGSTLPLKFNVYKGSTAMTSGVGAIFTTQRIGCDGSNLQEPLEELPTTGSTPVRYDTAAGQWIQNWATPSNGKNSCYRVSLTTADGSSLRAEVQLN